MGGKGAKDGFPVVLITWVKQRALRREAWFLRKLSTRCSQPPGPTHGRIVGPTHWRMA